MVINVVIIERPNKFSPDFESKLPKIKIIQYSAKMIVYKMPDTYDPDIGKSCLH